MATTRATGYVVTASVWNAVLSRLTDDGITFSGNLSGGSVSGTTGAFSSTLGVTGAATFSGGATLSQAAPQMTWIESGAAADNKRWDFVATSEDFYGRVLNDAVSVATSWLRVQRTGTTVDAVTLAASAISLSGPTTATRITGTAQPGFLAYNSSADVSVTTLSTVDFDTEVFDETGAFASDTFTAPVSGRYLFMACVQVTNSSGSAGVCAINLIASNHSTGLYLAQQNVANGDEAKLSGSVIVDMDASDTAYVRYEGATVTVGGGSTKVTWFAGRLLP